MIKEAETATHAHAGVPSNCAAGGTDFPRGNFAGVSEGGEM